MGISHEGRRKMRKAARAGRLKQAGNSRRVRRDQVRRALLDAGGWINVAELEVATGRKAGVVRDALKEIAEVEHIGTKYRIPTQPDETGGAS